MNRQDVLSLIEHHGREIYYRCPRDDNHLKNYVKKTFQNLTELVDVELERRERETFLLKQRDLFSDDDS